MNNAVITNSYIIANVRIGINFCVVAQFYIFSQVSKCANKNIFSVRSSFGNITWFLHTDHLLLNYFLVFTQQCSESSISILHSNNCCLNRVF